MKGMKDMNPKNKKRENGYTVLKRKYESLSIEHLEVIRQLTTTKEQLERTTREKNCAENLSNALYKAWNESIDEKDILVLPGAVELEANTVSLSLGHYRHKVSFILVNSFPDAFPCVGRNVYDVLLRRAGK